MVEMGLDLRLVFDGLVVMDEVEVSVGEGDCSDSLTTTHTSLYKLYR